MTIKIKKNLPDISLSELKQIAKIKGYYLKPITKYNKMVTCICGCKYHNKVDILGGRTLYECKQCGFKGLSGIGEYQARDGWNRAIKNYYTLKEKEQDGKN